MSEDLFQSRERLGPLRSHILVNVCRHFTAGRGALWETRNPSRRRLPTCVWAFILFLAVQPAAYGQSSTYARLVGTVRDPSGAVIPGVEVTVTARATNASSTIVTDDRGDYILDKLIPGQYDAQAELSGFKTQVSQDFRLQVAQVARVDFEMEPGEISELVTVRGQSTIIDTDNAEVGAVIEEKKIQDLPLRGRDLVKLAYLATGGTQERQEIGYSELLRLRRRVSLLQRPLFALESDHAGWRQQHGLHHATADSPTNTGDGAGVQGHHQQLLGRVRTSGWRGDQHAFQEWIQRVPRTRLVLLPGRETSMRPTSSPTPRDRRSCRWTTRSSADPWVARL